MAYWDQSSVTSERGTAVWLDSLRLACQWLTDRSMIRSADHVYVDSPLMNIERYRDWTGSFRGEYNAGLKRWDVACPIWHGGQGVKALARASQVLNDPALLEDARLAADFITRHQVCDAGDPNAGLILAYECAQPGISSSAILESLDGLFILSDLTGDRHYADSAIAALHWLRKRMFVPEQRWFRDEYFINTDSVGDLVGKLGRPLLDDGVFLTGYDLTGDKSLKQVAVSIADRLLADEDPLGNWKRYTPCNPKTGIIHPRHAYWWGRPLWMVFEATGDERYLDCCRRSAQWYVNAMRIDGGIFRDTGPGFETGSFGHATSGIACAVILWCELASRYGDTQWREPIQRALHFCRSVQFTDTDDENLRGAILEKVLSPNGSSRPPWYLRDLGTIFYVQALCEVIRKLPELLQ